MAEAHFPWNYAFGKIFPEFSIVLPHSYRLAVLQRVVPGTNRLIANGALRQVQRIIFSKSWTKVIISPTFQCTAFTSNYYLSHYKANNIKEYTNQDLVQTEYNFMVTEYNSAWHDQTLPLSLRSNCHSFSWSNASFEKKKQNNWPSLSVTRSIFDIKSDKSEHKTTSYWPDYRHQKQRNGWALC